MENRKIRISQKMRKETTKQLENVTSDTYNMIVRSDNSQKREKSEQFAVRKWSNDGRCGSVEDVAQVGVGEHRDLVRRVTRLCKLNVVLGNEMDDDGAHFPLRHNIPNDVLGPAGNLQLRAKVKHIRATAFAEAYT